MTRQRVSCITSRMVGLQTIGNDIDQLCAISAVAMNQLVARQI
jgi:hypothetical protein